MSYLNYICFFPPREQLGTVERSRQKYKAAPLTVEFVPFFYRKSVTLFFHVHTVFVACWWKNPQTTVLKYLDLDINIT